MLSDLDLIDLELRQVVRDVEILLQKPRLKKEYLVMALDFTKLNAAVALAQSNATALQNQAANSSEAADQASIDSATTGLDTANATTTSLLPVPPVVELVAAGLAYPAGILPHAIPAGSLTQGDSHVV